MDELFMLRSIYLLGSGMVTNKIKHIYLLVIVIGLSLYCLLR